MKTDIELKQLQRSLVSPPNTSTLRKQIHRRVRRAHTYRTTLNSHINRLIHVAEDPTATRLLDDRADTSDFHVKATIYLWHHHRRRAADLCSRDDTFIVTLCHHGRELLRVYQQHRSRLPSREIQEAQRIDPMASGLKPTLQRLQYLLCLCPDSCFTSPGGRADPRASQHQQRAWNI